MTDDVECIHGLAPGTCASCKPGVADGTAASLNLEAIRRAIDELAAKGEFRTTEVAGHAAVRDAHRHLLDDPQFRQLVGIRLRDERTRLGLKQVSEKGMGDAIWRKVRSGVETRPGS